jgi:hypothetical protein
MGSVPRLRRSRRPRRPAQDPALRPVGAACHQLRCFLSGNQRLVKTQSRRLHFINYHNARACLAGHDHSSTRGHEKGRRHLCDLRCPDFRSAPAITSRHDTRHNIEGHRSMRMDADTGDHSNRMRVGSRSDPRDVAGRWLLQAGPSFFAINASIASCATAATRYAPTGNDAPARPPRGGKGSPALSEYE